MARKLAGSRLTTVFTFRPEGAKDVVDATKKVNDAYRQMGIVTNKEMARYSAQKKSGGIGGRGGGSGHLTLDQRRTQAAKNIANVLESYPFYSNQRDDVRNAERRIQTAQKQSAGRIEQLVLQGIRSNEQGLRRQITSQRRTRRRSRRGKVGSDKPMLYIDMDGVVADFVGQYFGKFGKQWDSLPDMSKFSKAINAGIFDRLDEMPHMQTFMKRLKRHKRTHNIQFLTSANNTDPALIRRVTKDKRRWLDRHGQGDISIRVVESSGAKARLARPQDILIDDSGSAVGPWADAGGIAVRHKTVADTLRQLKRGGVIGRSVQIHNAEMYNKRHQRAVSTNPNYLAFGTELEQRYFGNQFRRSSLGKVKSTFRTTDWRPRRHGHPTSRAQVQRNQALKAQAIALAEGRSERIPKPHALLGHRLDDTPVVDEESWMNPWEYVSPAAAIAYRRRQRRSLNRQFRKGNAVFQMPTMHTKLGGFREPVITSTGKIPVDYGIGLAEPGFIKGAYGKPTKGRYSQPQVQQATGGVDLEHLAKLRREALTMYMMGDDGDNVPPWDKPKLFGRSWSTRKQRNKFHERNRGDDFWDPRIYWTGQRTDLENFDSEWYRQRGVWLSPSWYKGATYGTPPGKKPMDIGSSTFVAKYRAWQNQNPRVYPVQIRPGSQEDVDFLGSYWSGLQHPEAAAYFGSYAAGRDRAPTTNDQALIARKRGFDSIRMGNVIDYGGWGGNKYPQADPSVIRHAKYVESHPDTIAVFDPRRVRMLTGERLVQARALEREYLKSVELSERMKPKSGVELLDQKAKQEEIAYLQATAAAEKAKAASKVITSTATATGKGKADPVQTIKRTQQELAKQEVAWEENKKASLQEAQVARHIKESAKNKARLRGEIDAAIAQQSGDISTAAETRRQAQKLYKIGEDPSMGPYHIDWAPGGRYATVKGKDYARRKGESLEDFGARMVRTAEMVDTYLNLSRGEGVSTNLSLERAKASKLPEPKLIDTNLSLERKSKKLKDAAKPSVPDKPLPSGYWRTQAGQVVTTIDGVSYAQSQGESVDDFISKVKSDVAQRRAQKRNQPSSGLDLSLGGDTGQRTPPKPGPTLKQLEMQSALNMVAADWNEAITLGEAIRNNKATVAQFKRFKEIFSNVRGHDGQPGDADKIWGLAREHFAGNLSDRDYTDLFNKALARERGSQPPKPKPAPKPSVQSLLNLDDVQFKEANRLGKAILRGAAPIEDFRTFRNLFSRDPASKDWDLARQHFLGDMSQHTYDELINAARTRSLQTPRPGEKIDSGQLDQLVAENLRGKRYGKAPVYSDEHKKLVERYKKQRQQWHRQFTDPTAKAGKTEKEINDAALKWQRYHDQFGFPLQQAKAVLGNIFRDSPTLKDKDAARLTREFEKGVSQIYSVFQKGSTEDIRDAWAGLGVRPGGAKDPKDKRTYADGWLQNLRKEWVDDPTQAARQKILDAGRRQAERRRQSIIPDYDPEPLTTPPTFEELDREIIRGIRKPRYSQQPLHQRRARVEQYKGYSNTIRDLLTTDKSKTISHFQLGIGDVAVDQALLSHSVDATRRQLATFDSAITEDKKTKSWRIDRKKLQKIGFDENLTEKEIFQRGQALLTRFNREAALYDQATRSVENYEKAQQRVLDLYDRGKISQANVSQFTEAYNKALRTQIDRLKAVSKEEDSTLRKRHFAQSQKEFGRALKFTDKDVGHTAKGIQVDEKEKRLPGMRDITSAAILAVGPLSGLGARLMAFDAIRRRVGLEMAAASAALAGMTVGIIALTTSIFRFLLEFDKMQAKLLLLGGPDGQGVGRQQFVKENVDYIYKLAQGTGTSAQVLGHEFTKFAFASRKGALAPQVHELFETFALFGASLKLQPEEMQGVMKALTQMVSKGRVQREELQNQLGDRLPGAVQLFAEALGVTTVELANMTKAGTVFTDSALPKVMKYLQSEFNLLPGTKIQGLTAEVGRLQVSFEELFKTLNRNKNLNQRFSNLFSALSGAVKHVEQNLTPYTYLAGGAFALAGSAFLVPMMRAFRKYSTNAVKDWVKGFKNPAIVNTIAAFGGAAAGGAGGAPRVSPGTQALRNAYASSNAPWSSTNYAAYKQGLPATPSINPAVAGAAGGAAGAAGASVTSRAANAAATAVGRLSAAWRAFTAIRIVAFFGGLASAIGPTILTTLALSAAFLYLTRNTKEARTQIDDLVERANELTKRVKSDDIDYDYAGGNIATSYLQHTLKTLEVQETPLRHQIKYEEEELAKAKSDLSARHAELVKQGLGGTAISADPKMQELSDDINKLTAALIANKEQYAKLESALLESIPSLNERLRIIAESKARIRFHGESGNYQTWVKDEAAPAGGFWRKMDMLESVEDRFHLARGVQLGGLHRIAAQYDIQRRDRERSERNKFFKDLADSGLHKAVRDAQIQYFDMSLVQKRIADADMVERRNKRHLERLEKRTDAANIKFLPQMHSRLVELDIQKFEARRQYYETQMPRAFTEEFLKGTDPITGKKTTDVAAWQKVVDEEFEERWAKELDYRTAKARAPLLRRTLRMQDETRGNIGIISALEAQGGDQYGRVAQDLTRLRYLRRRANELRREYHIAGAYNYNKEIEENISAWVRVNIELDRARRKQQALVQLTKQQAETANLIARDEAYRIGGPIAEREAQRELEYDRAYKENLSRFQAQGYYGIRGHEKAVAETDNQFYARDKEWEREREENLKEFNKNRSRIIQRIRAGLVHPDRVTKLEERYERHDRLKEFSEQLKQIYRIDSPQFVEAMAKMAEALDLERETRHLRESIKTAFEGIETAVVGGMDGATQALLDSAADWKDVKKPLLDVSKAMFKEITGLFFNLFLFNHIKNAVFGKEKYPTLSLTDKHPDNLGDGDKFLGEILTRGRLNQIPDFDVTEPPTTPTGVSGWRVGDHPFLSNAQEIAWSARDYQHPAHTIASSARIYGPHAMIHRSERTYRPISFQRNPYELQYTPVEYNKKQPAGTWFDASVKFAHAVDQFGLFIAQLTNSPIGATNVTGPYQSPQIAESARKYPYGYSYLNFDPDKLIQDKVKTDIPRKSVQIADSARTFPPPAKVPDHVQEALDRAYLRYIQQHLRSPIKIEHSPTPSLPPLPDTIQQVKDRNNLRYMQQYLSGVKGMEGVQHLLTPPTPIPLPVDHTPFKLNKLGLKLIKDFEGFSPTRYRDVDKWAIGHGHQIDENHPLWDATINLQQAHDLLLQDTKWVNEVMNRSITNPNVNPLMQQALGSFIYNIGGPQFEGSTLLRKLNAGDYEGAASEFRRWTKVKVLDSSGKPILDSAGDYIHEDSPGLVTRRGTDERIFREGMQQMKLNIQPVINHQKVGPQTLNKTLGLDPSGQLNANLVFDTFGAIGNVQEAISQSIGSLFQAGIGTFQTLPFKFGQWAAGSNAAPDSLAPPTFLDLFNLTGGSSFADGGVITGRTPFIYNGNQLGEMGEAGTEGIFPLIRDSHGRLGVSGRGGGGKTIVIKNEMKIMPGANVDNFIANKGRINRELGRMITRARRQL